MSISQKVKELHEYMEGPLLMAFVDFRMEFNLDIRYIRFAHIEEVLDTKVLKGLYCQYCLRSHYCVLGRHRMLACTAYFLYGEKIDLDKQKYYQEYPLTPEALGKLNFKELLGIYYYNNYNLLTIKDLSIFGLRMRLLEIAENTSPYLLTI